MRFRRASASLCLLGSLAATAGATAAPTAQEIVAKARAAMKSMKTYQATVITTMTGGPMAVTFSAHLKTAGGKAWAQLGMAQAGAAQQSPFAPMLQNMILVDDGTHTWTYMPAMKQYRKGPSGGAKQFNVGEQLLSKADVNTTLTFSGSENVGGKAAYVVEARPKQPGKAQTGVIRMYFDQKTYHLVQARVNQTRPAMGQSPARQQTLLVLVRDEKVNQTIPESTFKFTPPPGAKEMSGGMGMGMRMPGGQGVPRK